jgi:hypothetical protein
LGETAQLNRNDSVHVPWFFDVAVDCFAAACFEARHSSKLVRGQQGSFHTRTNLCEGDFSDCGKIISEGRKTSLRAKGIPKESGWRSRAHVRRRERYGERLASAARLLARATLIVSVLATSSGGGLPFLVTPNNGLSCEQMYRVTRTTPPGQFNDP